MIEIKRTSDIQKSQHTNNYDGMSNITKRRCKGNCVNFKAKRPANGNFYASGYSRCNVCDIFLTPEGTRDGLFCNCCNIRVRNRPRTGAGKERYFEDVKRITKSEENNSSETNSSIKSEDDENFRLEESTKERIQEELNDTKKSAPIYEEIDESVKTFYELKDFLDTINLQDNYQLVMLKELIEYGENHKGEIAESLAYFNNKDTTDIDEVKYYFTVPVYDVLMNHGFVITTGYKRWRYLIYKLNVDLNESQKSGILEIIENKLNEYNKLHEIPGNEFPNSNNRGSINWNSRKCSETFPQIFLGNGHTEFNQVEHDIFKKYTDTPLFKKCTDIIKKDQILTNDEIISTFKVGNMGGIRYTKENDVIVLLSTHSDDYDDSIDTDSGLIIYTGEGKDDQELKNGNEKILNSQNTPMVFFKEVYQEQGVRKRGALDNKYKFVGVVKYQKHYWKTEKDRKVVKFVLEIQS